MSWISSRDMIPRAWQFVSASVTPEEPSSHTAILWLVYQFKLLCKELSSCNKLLFLNLYICTPRCCRPLIFQTVNSVESNSLSLKYQRLSSSSCEDKGIRKFKFLKVNFKLDCYFERFTFFNKLFFQKKVLKHFLATKQV